MDSITNLLDAGWIMLGVLYYLAVNRFENWNRNRKLIKRLRKSNAGDFEG